MMRRLRVDARGNAWSYGTQILSVDEDGRTIGNITKYSATTSRHQKVMGVYGADICIKDIPRGTVNLVRYLQLIAITN